MNSVTDNYTEMAMKEQKGDGMDKKLTQAKEDKTGKKGKPIFIFQLRHPVNVSGAFDKCPSDSVYI